MRLVHDRGVAAVEVVSTRPLVPAIQVLKSPPRLVVDLSNARLGPQAHKRTPVEQGNILAIRAEQHQDTPPIVRIVLDLVAPSGYTWDEAGNRLMVRLKPSEDVQAASEKTPVKPRAALGQAVPSGVVPVSGSVGDVIFAGSRLAAGSTLTAGADTAVLHLSRGGEVHVCPGTTVSVTPAKNTHDLMLGMSTGSLETHYQLEASADTVMTPDFRILFAGPGEFDYAISADSHGNTCVRTLMGNTSSAIVSELLGDRIYQVKPAEQVVFRGGRIDKVDSDVPLECGCPPPVPVLQAGKSDEEGIASADDHPAVVPNPEIAVPESGPRRTLSNGPEIQPLPPSKPDDLHIQVEAPFVFHAKKRAAAAPTAEVAALVMEPSARAVHLDAHVEPPPAPPQNAAEPGSGPRRFLRRLKGFFAGIFR